MGFLVYQIRYIVPSHPITSTSSGLSFLKNTLLSNKLDNSLHIWHFRQDVFLHNLRYRRPRLYGLQVTDQQHYHRIKSLLTKNFYIASKEWVIPAKPKPGRKPKVSEAAVAANDDEEVSGPHYSFNTEA